MDFSRIKNQSIVGLSSLFFITATQAGTPVLNFKLNGNPVINLDATGTATVSYTITNNSKKSHRLALSSTTPTGITSSGGLCVVGGKTSANPSPTCTLTLTINASSLPANHLVWAPIVCEANPNGTPNANQCFEPCHDKLDITRTHTPSATTLSTSIAPPSILALSVKNIGKNPALTGNARYVTFTNTGTVTATGLVVAANGLPAGSDVTTVPTTCADSLAPGATCTVTVTPGIDSTTDCKTGIPPTPGTITLSASNVASPAMTNVAVLDYGCQYQGGFLYSVDDTTPVNGSSGGKVASLVDVAEPEIGTGPQATSIIWSSNGSGDLSADVSLDIIPFIFESYVVGGSYLDAEAYFNSTYINYLIFPFPEQSAFTVCNGETDGQCNSRNIITFYDSFNTNFNNSGTAPFILSSGATNREYYAAGLCTKDINSYSDWYLPAICEMDSLTSNVQCPSGAQSMLANLSFLVGNPENPLPKISCNPLSSGVDCLAGSYFSSTGHEYNFYLGAWETTFDVNQLNGNSDYYYKAAPLGVRCSRILT
ncbi:hypothetical protein [Legionella feeleii]|uniref:Transmembrane protein (Fibronectin III domain and Gp5 C-terminal repeat) n=1 Tax=Legionella feeleii TaxID=453 RepID=A0A0W0U1T5_9GAMM|nr:hypothetical protein [Legionella feeleii]KTD01581.1 hypothetical protein Lfee_1011 [Legionella feeleii]